MDRKYAIINNNVVTDIKTISDEDYGQIISQNQLMVDIDDLIPEPQLGWILDGNKLTTPQDMLDPDSADSLQQSSQRKFGSLLLPILVDMIGARNLKFTRESSPVDVVALATQMASVKLLLETGALKTARGLCYQLKALFTDYADILDYAITQITNFLVTNGWN